MTTLRWGILSTAKIAREWLIPALQESPHNEVVAIASRDLKRGQETAQQMGIGKVYDDYQSLLEAGDIDAIYNPLPNHLHVPYSIKALEAGKHVLCEKPLGLNAEEISQLIAVSKQHPKQLMMEGFMYRFHPQWQTALDWIQNGHLGNINSIEASFTFFNQDPDNVRNQSGIGGGSLMDVGCYCISAARTLFNKEPQKVLGRLDMDARFGVDKHATGLLDFGSGTASFFSSTQSAPSQRVHVIGERATLTFENPFYRRDVPSRLLIRTDNDDQEIVVGHYNHYVEQVNEFAKAALSNGPCPTPLLDALQNMKVIDAIVASNQSGEWQTI